jgi:glutathione peroxidase
LVFSLGFYYANIINFGFWYKGDLEGKIFRKPAVSLQVTPQVILIQNSNNKQITIIKSEIQFLISTFAKKEMKNIMIALGILLTVNLSAHESFYDFTVKDIDGKEYSFSQLKGKKVMVVNVASKCGYTKQYQQLQAVYAKYGGNDFVIIGFPANNFLWQEPGTDEEIKTFCSTNYQVTFPMMSKISVKGSDMHPLYHWLTEKDKNGMMDSKVKWNFQKYLISADGKLEKMFLSKVVPDDPEIIKWIEE